MPTILSPSVTVQLGDTTTYLAANYVSNGALFGARIIKPTPPTQIAYVTDALRWGIEGGAESDASLRMVANYAYRLYGRFQLEAQYIINGAGGGSVVPTPIGSSSPPPYDWKITTFTTDTKPLKAGDGSVTLEKFIGLNIEFTRNNITQYTTDNGDGTSFYAWNRISGLFTCFPEAAEDELFRIFPATGAGGGIVTEDNPDLTSGLLAIGRTYEIIDYEGGDDFTNVATVLTGIINTNGCTFTCTGTTPTNWSNSSVLRIIN